eukprot:3923266-Pleurochrysis_carterae.AAC.1
MAPPTAQRALPSDIMHVMSQEAYEYIFDWASLVSISPTNPADGNVRGLRCFAIPKSFSTHTGLRGHYLINTHGRSERQQAEVVELPAIVQFLDESLSDGLAITF